LLTCLRIRHFAIIDELEVGLEPGLNVLTGETGAGKSILVEALGLVLGARGRPDLVRSGCESAEVEALVDLDAELAGRLEAIGLAPEGEAGELIIRRVVQANGRTRAYADGRLVTASQLAGLAAGIADISSQHEHHSLADPSRHLGYLDAFGRLGDESARVAAAHGALRHATEALADLESRAGGDRKDLLRFQVQEIDDLAPTDGEIGDLEAERERLRHAERLARAAGGAEDEISSRDGSVCESLARVASELREVGKIDGRLLPFANQVAEAQAQLEDAARELGIYASSITVDGERLGEVEERLDRLKRLVRKYGGSIASVLEHLDQSREELDELERFEERRSDLRNEAAVALDEARSAALELSEKRHAAAEHLGRGISAELSSLGMGEACVLVEVARLEDRAGELSVEGARLTANGIDRAEFLIAPNRGEQARPLRRIASGGELSRSMLAIKRVIAGLRPAGLYVFDEVDAGVGGAVAEVIGRKLRDVARHHQVLCITHLPQIAVYADAHLRIRKDVVGDRTVSFVERLEGKERLDEVARMLGGLRVTAKTRAAAAEMIRSATPAS